MSSLPIDTGALLPAIPSGTLTVTTSKTLSFKSFVATCITLTLELSHSEAVQYQVIIFEFCGTCGRSVHICVCPGGPTKCPFVAAKKIEALAQEEEEDMLSHAKLAAVVQGGVGNLTHALSSSFSNVFHHASSGVFGNSSSSNPTTTSRSSHNNTTTTTSNTTSTIHEQTPKQVPQQQPCMATPAAAATTKPTAPTNSASPDAHSPHLQLDSSLTMNSSFGNFGLDLSASIVVNNPDALQGSINGGGDARASSSSLDRPLLDNDTSSVMSICNQFLAPTENVVKAQSVSKTRFFRAQRRLIVLTTQPRLFYVEVDTMSLKGSLSLGKGKAQVTRDGDSGFILKMTGGKDYPFATASTADTESWMAALNKVLA